MTLASTKESFSFSSTRQRQSQAVLIDEGKPGFEAQTDSRNESAFVLHVMDPDGNNIHQVSFNQSHDIDPTVLANGRLLWSRWDNAPGSTGAGMNLYTANPDGTDLQLLYGAHSHLTGTNNSFVEFVKAREMPDGRILALIRPDHHVGATGGRRKVIDHPEVGTFTVDCDVLIDGDAELKIVILSATPGTEDETKFKLAVMSGVREQAVSR